MLGKLVSKIAGPKVMLGITVASVIAIGSLLYLYRDAATDAAQAVQRAAGLEQDLADTRDEVEQLRRERQRLEEALAARREAARQARARADEAESELRRIYETDEQAGRWAAGAVPAAVADELQSHAGPPAPEDGGGAGTSAEAADGGVPGPGAEDPDQR